VRTHLTESDLTDISEEAHAYVSDIFHKYQTGPLYTPSHERGVITLPGHQGGAEWGGGAFNPNTNTIFVNVNEAPTIHRLVRFYDRKEAESTPLQNGAITYFKNCSGCHGIERLGVPPSIPSLVNTKLSRREIQDQIKRGQGIMPSFPQLKDHEVEALIAFLMSDGAVDIDVSSLGVAKYTSDAPFLNDHQGYPGIKPPWGSLVALNLATGNMEWKVPFGEYPELVKRGIRNTGAKNFGGPVATAGGLIFIAATPDEKIRAFNQRDGKVLWESQLPAAAYATPSTYMIDGKQYIAIVCGGGGKNSSPYGDAVVAFALEE
jgi:quinoprotein glucose dehydrogenase